MTLLICCVIMMLIQVIITETYECTATTSNLIQNNANTNCKCSDNSVGKGFKEFCLATGKQSRHNVQHT